MKKNMVIQGIKKFDSVAILWLCLIVFVCTNILFAAGRIVKIGAISMEATHEFSSSLAKKINEVTPLIDEAGAQKLDMIALPEYYFRGKSLASDYQDLNDSVVLDSMKALALKNKINIAFQVVEIDAGKVYNTVVVVNRSGEYVGKYRKVNLPPEEYLLTPGDSYKIFDLDFGKVGILICWDFWFTDPVKALIDMGAELIFVQTWCNIERNLKTNSAESGVPIAFSVLRLNCGSGEEDLPSSVFDHHGDAMYINHMVGQNKIAIGSVLLGGYHNLAQNKSILTSAGTDAGHPGTLAVDGKYSTERDAPAESQTSWKALSLPQSIEIDLGKDYQVDRISIAQFNTDNYQYQLEGKAESDTVYKEINSPFEHYETFLEHGIAGSEILSARLDTVGGGAATKIIRYIKLTVSSTTRDSVVINEIKVFGYDDSDPTVIDESQNIRIPAESRLLPNYPNPFNPETRIQYVLRESSDVNLTIYNLTGQVVKELVNKYMPAGKHMVKWNGTNHNSLQVSSGVYVAKIELESNTGNLITDSQKLILVR